MTDEELLELIQTCNHLDCERKLIYCCGEWYYECSRCHQYIENEKAVDISHFSIPIAQ